MRIQYELSAAEILKKFGYTKRTGRERLDTFMQEKKISLPGVYQEFMEVAMDCPMLETADLWIGQMGAFDMVPYFLYEEIREGIEDEKADWEANPERYEDNESYYLFYRLPEEKWKEKTCDYLEIGSDYGAGVVKFGIRRQDLEEEDPPVFMNHEADAITDWQKMYEHLSDYLLDVVLSALTGMDYSTAQRALEDKGWEYLDYEDYEMEAGEEDEDELLTEEAWQKKILTESGIDLHLVHRRTSVYGGELFLCQNMEKDCFYLGRTEEDEWKLTIIEREE